MFLLFALSSSFSIGHLTNALSNPAANPVPSIANPTNILQSEEQKKIQDTDAEKKLNEENDSNVEDVNQE